jgi:transcriptional regulator with XRE-family HTH domain
MNIENRYESTPWGPTGAQRAEPAKGRTFGKAVGTKLAELRMEQGLTLREVADRFRIATGRPCDGSRVHKMEAGRSLDFVDLAGMAMVFGCGIKELLLHTFQLALDGDDGFSDTTMTASELFTYASGEAPPPIPDEAIESAEVERANRELAGRIALDLADYYNLRMGGKREPTAETILALADRLWGRGPAEERNRRADAEVTDRGRPVNAATVTAARSKASAAMFNEVRDELEADPAFRAKLADKFTRGEHLPVRLGVEFANEGLLTSEGRPW